MASGNIPRASALESGTWEEVSAFRVISVQVTVDRDTLDRIFTYHLEDGRTVSVRMSAVLVPIVREELSRAIRQSMN